MVSTTLALAMKFFIANITLLLEHGYFSLCCCNRSHLSYTSALLYITANWDIVYEQNIFTLTEYLQGYDIALLRLKCYHKDVYEGVAANHASDYSKPLVFACKFSSAPGYEHIIALAYEDGKVALQDTTVKNKTEGPLEGTQVWNKYSNFEVIL